MNRRLRKAVGWRRSSSCCVLWRPRRPPGPVATIRRSMAASGVVANKWGRLDLATGSRPRAATSPAAARAGGRQLRASAATDLAPCDDDPTFLCGTVPVPLDRRHPDGRMVNIALRGVPPHRSAAQGRRRGVRHVRRARLFGDAVPEVRVLVLRAARGRRDTRPGVRRPAWSRSVRRHRLSRHCKPAGRSTSPRPPAMTSSATPPTCTARPTWPTISRTCARRSATARSTCSAARTRATT